MASEVLHKTRKINKTLQTSGGSNVSFDLLAGALGEVLNSNVYVVSDKGKVLGLHLNDIADSSVVEDNLTKKKMFPQEYNINALKISETLENLTGDKLLEIFPFEQDRIEKKTTIVPILGSGQRLGTLLLSRYNNTYKDEDLVMEMLPVIDNFESAIKMDDNNLTDEVSKFLSGFKMIYGNLLGILEKYDVKPIDGNNKPFDPAYHQAVMTEKCDMEPGMVIEVLRKGYVLKDKVLRPAMVKVSE